MDYEGIARWLLEQFADVMQERDELRELCDAAESDANKYKAALEKIGADPGPDVEDLRKTNLELADYVIKKNYEIEELNREIDELRAELSKVKARCQELERAKTVPATPESVEPPEKRGYHRWTEEENEWIRQHLNRATDMQVAERFGVSQNAAMHQMQRIKAQTEKPVTAADRASGFFTEGKKVG